MKVVNKDYYVLTNNTKPTEPRTYRNYFNKLLKQLDIPRLKFHGLRHSFATRCIESHCDYKTVSVLLGLPLERSNVCSNEWYTYKHIFNYTILSVCISIRQWISTSVSLSIIIFANQYLPIGWFRYSTLERYLPIGKCFRE